MANTIALNRFNLKEFIKQGNLTALEDIVLQGNGDRLLGESSPAPLVQEERSGDYCSQSHHHRQIGCQQYVFELRNLEWIVLTYAQGSC